MLARVALTANLLVTFLCLSYLSDFNKKGFINDELTANSLTLSVHRTVEKNYRGRKNAYKNLFLRKVEIVTPQQDEERHVSPNLQIDKAYNFDQSRSDTGISSAKLLSTVLTQTKKDKHLFRDQTKLTTTASTTGIDGKLHSTKKHNKLKTDTKSTELRPSNVFRSSVASTANRFDNTDSSGNTTGCHAWCHRGKKMKLPYFLTAVLLVRIYVKDKAQLSSREMLQWLMYLRYAGVEHVYIYDAYVFANESQRDALGPLIDEEYVTYINWHHRAFPYSIDGTQIAAYQDCIDRYGKNFKWQTAIDIDEYPFSVKDKNQGFMKRFISAFSERYKNASEISMNNYLFLGKPLDDKSRPLLIDRIWRRTPSPSNNLVKPIYQPLKIKAASVHHNILRQGTCLLAGDYEMRMNHYWGARLQDWGEDSPEILNITIPDRSMETIIEEIKRCDTFLGKDLLYRKKWN